MKKTGKEKANLWEKCFESILLHHFKGMSPINAVSLFAKTKRVRQVNKIFVLAFIMHPQVQMIRHSFYNQLKTKERLVVCCLNKWQVISTPRTALTGRSVNNFFEIHPQNQRLCLCYFPILSSFCLCKCIVYFVKFQVFKFECQPNGKKREQYAAFLFGILSHQEDYFGTDNNNRCI